MQVFVPELTFEASVGCLDPSRLGNQIYREGKTLIMGGWPNHPCSKAWADYRVALAEYCLCGLRELTKRGRHYATHYDFFQKIRDSGPLIMPHWWNDVEVHDSHKSNLIRKKPEWYVKYWPHTPNNLPYKWPV